MFADPIFEEHKPLQKHVFSQKTLARIKSLTQKRWEARRASDSGLTIEKTWAFKGTISLKPQNHPQAKWENRWCGQAGWDKSLAGSDWQSSSYVPSSFSHENTTLVSYYDHVVGLLWTQCISTAQSYTSFHLTFTIASKENKAGTVIAVWKFFLEFSPYRCHLGSGLEGR